MKAIYYYEGNYKYQLGLEHKHQLPFSPPCNSLQKSLDLKVINHQYFSLSASGLLTIKVGYAWDGASGPTIDTDDSMRGSLIHDVGYQMIGAGLLPMEYRLKFDEEFLSILIEDGMNDFRAHAWYKAVRAFGRGPASKGERPLRKSPNKQVKSYPNEVRFGRA